MPRYRETSREDWITTIILLSLLVTVIIVATRFLMPTFWYVWLALVAAGLTLLLTWHTRTFGYRCQKCGCEYAISILANLRSLHGVAKNGAGTYGWKYLKCPRCGETSKAIVVRRA